MPDAPAPPPDHPGFGVPLGRLLRHRGLGAAELASRAGCAEAAIRSVLSGQVPGEELLRRLAPALGHRTVDVFLLAGVPVPEDLAPLDAASHQAVASLIHDVTMRLPAAARRELLLNARSLPQAERREAFAPHWLPASRGNPGNWIIRMLRYRNFGPMGLAHVMALLTDTCLSAATYFMIGGDRAELTPRRVTDFAFVLGIDAQELAAIAGLVLDEAPPPPAQRLLDACELLWEMRRLSVGQAQGLVRTVQDMAREVRDAARPLD